MVIPSRKKLSYKGRSVDGARPPLFCLFIGARSMLFSYLDKSDADRESLENFGARLKAWLTDETFRLEPAGTCLMMWDKLHREIPGLPRPQFYQSEYAHLYAVVSRMAVERYRDQVGMGIGDPKSLEDAYLLGLVSIVGDARNRMIAGKLLAWRDPIGAHEVQARKAKQVAAHARCEAEEKADVEHQARAPEERRRRDALVTTPAPAELLPAPVSAKIHPPDFPQYTGTYVQFQWDSAAKKKFEEIFRGMGPDEKVRTTLIVFPKFKPKQRAEVIGMGLDGDTGYYTRSKKIRAEGGP